jgi:hypothetical protein
MLKKITAFRYPEERGISFRAVSMYLPDYTVSHSSLDVTVFMKTTSDLINASFSVT